MNERKVFKELDGKDQLSIYTKRDMMLDSRLLKHFQFLLMNFQYAQYTQLGD